MSGGSQIFFGAATPACWTVLRVLGVRHAPEADAPRPVQTVRHQEVGVVPLQGADTWT